MKNWLLVGILFSSFGLTSCTGINHKCDYIPPGTCWRNHHCEPIQDPAQCRSFWSCGYYYHFYDQ